MDIPQDRLFSNSTILTEAWGHLLDLLVYPVANRKCFSPALMNFFLQDSNTFISTDKFRRENIYTILYKLWYACSVHLKYVQIDVVIAKWSYLLSYIIYTYFIVACF